MSEKKQTPQQPPEEKKPAEKKPAEKQAAKKPMPKNKKILLIAVASAVAVALIVTAVILIVKLNQPDEPPSTLTPDYPAPPAHEGAEDIEGEDEEKLEAPSGGGAVGLVYSDQIAVDLSDKKATLRFDNPTRSTQNISLELMIGETKIFDTGTLYPGKRVTEVNLQDAIVQQLQAGVYTTDAKFVVYFYDPETNERSVVNSEIAVTVTVQE